MNDKMGLYGPTSFAELDELMEARQEAERILSIGSAFSMMSDNIIMDDQIPDKAVALSSLVSEYADRVATNKEKGGPGGGAFF